MRPGTTSTNGSRSSSTPSNGPSGIGSTPKVRSSRPGSTMPIRPSSLAASERRTSTPGHASAKRADDRRQDRVPTLWYTPTRSMPVSPAA